MTFLRNIFGATPVDLDDINELIPEHVSTQAELNEWEQANIVEAQLWFSDKSCGPNEMLNLDFIKELHRRMFDKTWRWAGEFRKTNKNIGVDWNKIPENLKLLFDDANFQVSNEAYVIDETVVRFHHRLVSIHPFVNGNGRLSRFAADLFLISNKQKVFSWGRNCSEEKEVVRKKYIKALKAADEQDYSLLIDFVKT